MILGDLLRTARTRLNDDVSPYLWSDETLVGYFNDAVREVAIRKRLFLDTETPECCTATVAAGTQRIALHKRVLALRTVRADSTRRALDLTTLKVMDKDRPEWPYDEGEPKAVIVDRDTGTVFLWPKPIQEETLRLAVWRLPLEIDELEVGDDDAEPAVDEAFHIDLVDWVEHLAYLNADADTKDPARSADAEVRFTLKFGRRPSAREIAVWGISPPRGQRAEFL